MPKSPLFADVELARRLEAADAWVGLESAQIHAQLYPLSGAQSVPVPGGFAVFTGVGSPLTQVLGLGMNGPVSSSQMEELETFFRNHGSDAQIELCPFADPSVLVHLADRGYVLRDCTNMMVKRLRPGAPVPATPAAVVVRQCVEEEAVLWANTVIHGFSGMPVHAEENIATLISLFHRPGAVCILAWVNGQPAGGGALSTVNNVAAFYGASTLPELRRRGVQSAIIHALLSHAEHGGCDLGYSLTQPGSASQRNLERQDFHVAYTRFTMVRTMGAA